MKILIIGGTQFLGRAITTEALASGHQVSLFHRGKTGPDLFPEAQHILGDRDGGLGAIGDRTFDAVIDVSGYVPRLVRDSVQYLAPKVGHYQFISTISVYDLEADGQQPMSEDWPRSKTDMIVDEKVTGETYSALKVLCEDEVWAGMPGKSFCLRPGYVIGAHDSTDRFTHWVSRIGEQDEVLVPERLSQPLQVIDARDLAAFSLRSVEVGRTGATHATGRQTNFGEMLELIKTTLGRSTKLVPYSGDDIQPGDFPLESPPMVDPMLSTSIEKALGEGLQLRSYADSIRDIWAWHQTRDEVSAKAGISREREEEILNRLAS